MFVVAFRAKKRSPTRTTAAIAMELVRKESIPSGFPKNGRASGLTSARKSLGMKFGMTASIREFTASKSGGKVYKQCRKSAQGLFVKFFTKSLSMGFFTLSE